MKITDVRVTSLRLPLKKPYHWSQGIREDFVVNLLELESDAGLVGIGECTVAPEPTATARILRHVARHVVGLSPWNWAPVYQRILKQDFLAFGANNMRFAHQLVSGIDMAMLDLAGKAAGEPVFNLLGGAHRDSVGYFYFLQGDTPDELAADAAAGAAAGEPIIYLKVGRTEAEDLAIVEAVRGAIGNARLRLDANESWDPHTAIRMIRRLERFDIDFVEQPTPSWSLEALAHVRASVDTPIAADQSIFTIYDVYEVCRRRAADLLVIGPRETGGLAGMMKVAAIAEAAGLKVCIHSSFTTGITTCAEHHLARAIPNLDDGNQIMWQLARDNIVAHPPLRPERGRLSLPAAPGLGFELDREQVAAAAAAFAERA